MFLSTYVNKVDRKGRVSVPATFRAALSDQRFPGIVIFPSNKYPALDGNGIDRMDELMARLGSLPEWSDEHENLSVLMFADSQRLPFDPEGRITLPEDLARHASITDSAAFVGLGKSFQIWEPDRYAAHRDAVRERARRQETTIPAIGAPAARGVG
ncbi:MAG TPA: division/cell wall cluster transcriptional repressor MraZ [Stellaceae bacterium]|nr:division/cell wall cluster transcriptional repressor MraZ [Stellaceae bacterium]